MTPLTSAISKIKEHAQSKWVGGGFSLALTPEEIQALNEAYPNGLELKR